MEENALQGNAVHTPIFYFNTYGQSCYAALKGFASSLFRAENASIFYAYFSLYSHYDLLHLPESSDMYMGQPFDLQRLEEYILTSKLGLNLDVLSIDAPLVSVLQEALRQNCLVLVPTNKGQLLWQQPSKNLYPYPLLVTAYDQQARCYTVFDDARNYPAAHVNKQDLHVSILLDERRLEEAFHAPMNTFAFAQNTVQTLRATETNGVMGLEDALKDCIKQLVSSRHRIGQVCKRKLQCLCLQDPTLGEQARLTRMRNQIRYINTHKILGVLLQQFLSTHNRERGQEIYQYNLEAWQAWKTLLTLNTIGTFRSGEKQTRLEQLVKNVKMTEERFLEALSSIIVELPE